MMRVPVLAICLLALAACTGPRTIDPADTTSTRQPFLLQLGALRIETVPEASRADHFVDQQRGERLAETAGRFLVERLRAIGGPGRMRAVIEQATLHTEPLPTAGGIRGLVMREADRLLVGTLAVRLVVEDESGRELAFARSEVERKRPILERTAVLAREADAEDVINGLLRQLDDALVQAVNENLDRWTAL